MFDNSFPYVDRDEKRMTDITESPLLAAALRYAKAGVFVFPTRLGIRGDNKKLVQPIDSWKEASTTDPDIIRAWYTGDWKDTTVCIDCGKNGIVGVDQDVSDGKSGPDNWAALDPPRTARVSSPSGGFHDYYRADPDHPVSVDNTGAVADGVDVRGEGGFLFAPPSVDPRGGGWEWRDGEPDFTDLPIVPRVVTSRIETARNARKRKTPARPDPLADASFDQVFGTASTVTNVIDFGPQGGYKTKEQATGLLDRELKAFLLLTEEGSSRSHTIAQRLGPLAGHGVSAFWTYEQAQTILLSACVTNGFVQAHGETYALQQIDSGLKYGMSTPWIETVNSVTSQEQVIAGRLRTAMLSRSKMKELPDPIPLIDGLIYRDSIVVISGKFGTYKSFVSVALACSLSTGANWLGYEVKEKVPVIYTAAEGAYGIRRRVEAWEERYGVVSDDFYLIPLAVRINRPEDMRELKTLISETGAKVVIFDTLHASTPGVDENDSGEMGMVMDVLRDLRDQCGITAILPHHTGHGGVRARGSSSIEDDADTAFVIELGDGKTEDRGIEVVRTLKHRKSKDDELISAIQLSLNLVPETKSAYVSKDDEYSAESKKSNKPIKDTPRTAVKDLEPWAREGGKHGDTDLPAQLLQVLWDIGQGVGMVKSETRKSVAARWYGGRIGNVNGTLDDSSFNKAWKRFEQHSVDPGSVFVSMKDGYGKVDPDWVKRFKDA